MPRAVAGVDIGTRSSKWLRGYAKGNTFVATGFAFAEHEGGADLAAAWDAVAGAGKLGPARVAIDGHEVNVRYTRVPRVPDWQLKKLMRFEVEEIGGQSGAEVAADFNVLPELPELEDEDVVLLAMAREALLEEHLQGLTGAGGTLEAFTPSSIALYNAWLRFGVLQDDTVLVADIGQETLDVVVARGPDLLFARNLSGGSVLFDQAIAQRLGCPAPRAEQLKRSVATLEPRERYADPNAEKASRACLAPAGQLLSLLQSALLFCKSQVKLTSLKLDRVMICGGGARLDGLDRYLSNALGVKVERFDPFRVVDTSRLAPAEAKLLGERALESVVALGLAMAATDPGCYAIEILPAKLRARRELLQGKSFLVGAAALALGFLGFAAYRRHSELSLVREDVSRLQRQAQAARGVDGRTRGLLDENARLKVEVDALYELAGSGAQLARALSALETSMPPDFWIEKLSSGLRFDAELGVERTDPRPIVHVEGRAREGTEAANLLFQKLVDGVRGGLAGATTKQSLSPTGTSFTLDITTLAPPPSAAPAAEEHGEKAGS